MAKTRHFKGRMSQRGITQSLADLATQFGYPDGDKYVLGKKGCQALIEALRQTERQTLKVLDKGGLVVIEADGSFITTYNADSFNRSAGRF